MKLSLLLSLLSVYIVTIGQVIVKPTHYQTYTLIRLVKIDVPAGKNPVFQAAVYHPDIDILSEPLIALAAYYSALSGSNCDRDDNCGLTSALGLGKQSSIEHIGILRKWFHDDSKVNSMIDQNCFVGISGANHFCEYNFLNFEHRHDTVIVNYEIQCYDQGRFSNFNGQDKAVIGDNQIKFTQRSIPWNKDKL